MQINRSIYQDQICLEIEYSYSDMIWYSYSDNAYLRYGWVHQLVVRLLICQVVVQRIDVFLCRVYSKVPHKRSYPHMHCSCSSFTPWWWTKLSKSGRTGIGAIKNVSEVDGERNHQISVHYEGRLSTSFELLDLMVVGNSSG